MVKQLSVCIMMSAMLLNSDILNGESFVEPKKSVQKKRKKSRAQLRQDCAEKLEQVMLKLAHEIMLIAEGQRAFIGHKISMATATSFAQDMLQRLHELKNLKKFLLTGRDEAIRRSTTSITTADDLAMAFADATALIAAIEQEAVRRVHEFLEEQADTVFMRKDADELEAACGILNAALENAQEQAERLTFFLNSLVIH